jgi:la-related protein 1
MPPLPKKQPFMTPVAKSTPVMRPKENQHQKVKPLDLEKKDLKHIEKKLLNDLVESPISKNKFKNFSALMKENEKNSTSFKSVVIQSLDKLYAVPQKLHWRAFLDLADFAKRESRFEEARNLFHLVSIIQPFAYQGWLEFSKMEEECGNQKVCRDILLQGLKFNPLNENLFIKAIKVEEKMGNFEEIRNMVKSTMAEPIDKTWRVLLEGALFEGRCGNREAARDQFRYLLNKCKSHGPIYLEASKFEERENFLEHAIDLCDEGLEYNVKYSPLWFHYLRLYEKSSEKLRE